ncbi:type II toxin-antitoxin system YafQ family toxin [Phormidesmis priestleyi]|uniref:type II toxin-antitoxin system RelE/ParE family toxin n=1 Tax=Phormidesmis priestleyi TaxID=268141 RepID=UPI000943FD7B|nr:type II toxin-antitoxin system mRNA interferase toxin, RelE/StbE family [Phormidesmis priestleyi]
MPRLNWSPKFAREYKRFARRNPQLRPLIERTLRLLAEDPRHPALRTHKLKGELADVWSCSIDYNTRILFEFAEDSESNEIIIGLLRLGVHDDVY